MDYQNFESEEALYESFEISPEAGILVAVERCPLCSLSRVPIYCKDCVNSGNFSRKSDEFHSYKRLQVRLHLVTEERETLVARIQERVASKERRAAKRNEIQERKKRIEILKLKLIEARKKKDKASRQHSDLRKLRKHNVNKLQKSHESVALMQKNYRTEQQDFTRKMQDLEEKWELLGDQRCEVIMDIVNTIFPITEPGVGMNSMALDMSTMSRQLLTDLTDACHLAYMSGRWVHTDRDGNNFITIVESALPGNGDYSAAVTSEEMRMHVAAMTDDTSSKADHPTANISSGLCYTTELLHILANILHVLLPRRVHIKEFGFNDFTEQKLAKSVSRLNHNIVHLCFAQGVDKSAIVANHTMHNLLLCLRSHHLGRTLHYKEDESLVERANDPAGGYAAGDDSESETTDWDIVNSRDIPDIPPDVLTVDITTTTTTMEGNAWSLSPATYASAVFGGVQSNSIVGSLASLWRTARGTKADDS